MNFEGKTVVVTGSSRSLGRQIVLDFAIGGANVVINYNNNFDKAMDAKTKIEKLGVNVLLIKCDVSNESEVCSMVSEVISKFGKIDILVNNAGVCNDSLFDEKTCDDFVSVLKTNLVGTYLVSKYVGKFMLDAKDGKIINIASDNAFVSGYPESAEYDASKSGVVSLSHNMAKFYSPYVRVNCVCPGWIDTDMNKGLTSKQKSDICDKLMLHRFASSKEISNVVLFLASDMSSYVNDSVITVNGGVL